MEFRDWSIEEVAEKLSKAGLEMFSAVGIAIHRLNVDFQFIYERQQGYAKLDETHIKVV
jgi:hypothetical protein